MKHSIFLTFFVFLFIFKSGHAQNLNQYKYVLVPDKYEFLEEEDKYQLNSLTEFLFEKYGFTAILEGETRPIYLQVNPCSALNVEVISDSGFFSFVTRVKVILKNCGQQVVFESKQGKSRLKKYKFAYQEALRDAFTSIKRLNYAYSGPKESEILTTSKTKTVLRDEPNSKNRLDDRFVYKGKEYLLEKNGGTFVLKQSGKKPIAFLNQTSKGNFVYRSGKLNGTAYFDEKGNLIVEYFDIKAKTMKKKVYVLKKER